MSDLQLEILAELRRQSIQQEMKAIRLAEKVRRARAPQNSLLQRNMAALGNWMIAAGERLKNATSQSGNRVLSKEYRT